ncbi:MAG: alpha/beta fold hydrolase [Chitinophagales bacterium]
MRGTRFLIAGLLILVAAAASTYYIFPQQTGNFMIRSLWRLAGLQEKAVQVGDHKIVYMDGGHGEPLILVHGFGGDKSNWIYLARYFTGDYHVVIPDLPGFGDRTRLWTASYDYPEQVERLHSFLNKMDLKQVNLVGNSMGGEICGLYAVKYPKEVKTLTLIDAAGVNAPNESKFLKLLAYGQNPLIAGSREEYDSLLNFVFFNPPYMPQDIKQNMADQAIAHKPLNEKTFRVIRSHIDMLEPQLNKIQAPVLIIWGYNDQVLDSSSVFVYKKYLKSYVRIVRIKQAGHLPMAEKPKETAKHLRTFLDDFSPNSGS